MRLDIAKYQALNPEAGPRHTGEPEDGQETTGRAGRVRGRGTIGVGPPLHREAWHQINRWYKAMFDHAAPPAWVTLERITAERMELCRYVPPLGTNVPISVQPFLVYDSMPAEEKIEWAVTRLHNHRSGGPSGLRGSDPNSASTSDPACSACRFLSVLRLARMARPSLRIQGLIFRNIQAHGESLVDEPPRCRRDPSVLPRFPSTRFWYGPP